MVRVCGVPGIHNTTQHNTQTQPQTLTLSTNCSTSSCCGVISNSPSDCSTFLAVVPLMSTDQNRGREGGKVVEGMGGSSHNMKERRGAGGSQGQG